MSQSGTPGQRVTQLVYFSLDTSNTVVPSDYKLLGGVSSVTGLGITKTTGDVTTGDSTEKIITQQSQDGSVNGFYRRATAANQAELQDYIDDDFESCGWLRFVEPRAGSVTKTRDVPVVFKSMASDATVGEAMTFELAYESNGTPQTTIA